MSPRPAVEAHEGAGNIRPLPISAASNPRPRDTQSAFLRREGIQVNDGALELLGISGSLRSGSYNSALLRAASRLVPEGVRIEIYDGMGDLPLYNDDVRLLGEPPAVTRMKQRVAAADGILIVTPEYNNSVPGPLQNAIDWLSRPAAESPLRGKPAGIAGVATGNFGTVRAQTALRQVLA